MRFGDGGREGLESLWKGIVFFFIKDRTRKAKYIIFSDSSKIHVLNFSAFLIVVMLH